MRAQFRVVTVPSSDTSQKPAILLSYDDKKYLFNCGEGTQRQIISQGIPLRKVKEIFTTYGWDSHGGLAGVLLAQTVDRDILKIGVHGPKNLAYFLATLRAGQQRGRRYTDEVSLRLDEYSKPLPEPFKDNNLIIQPIVTVPDEMASQAQEIQAHVSSREDSDTTNHISPQELNDPVRVQNIAKAVWSGQFLQRGDDGVWGCVSSNQNRQRPGIPDSSPAPGKVRNKKRKLSAASYSTSITDYQTTPEQRSAYWFYMNSDLPMGIQPFQAAVSYYIRSHPTPGKFDPERARALGISPGPAFGRLVKGFTVQASDGTTVYPHDVMGPAPPNPGVLIIDCPSVAYIPQLTSNAFWSSCRGPGELAVIVHTCGKGVLEDAAYIAFMASFDSSVQHFISREDYYADLFTNEKSVQQLSDLRNMDQQIYPTLYTTDEAQNSSFDRFEKEAINASVLPKCLQFTPTPYLSLSMFEETETEIFPGLKRLLDQYIQRCHQVRSDVEALAKDRTDTYPGGDVEIITLGTGSAGPSRYRNVASILVRAPKNLSFVFDCGEGTVGQLKRLFGEAYVEELRSIRLIYISHMHADHHLGLIGLIKEWTLHNTNNSNKLIILCPFRYRRSIEEYENVEPIGISRVSFVDTIRLAAAASPTSSPLEQFSHLSELSREIPEISSVRTISNGHSEASTSLRIDHQDGWSIAYSGDTRPNAAFARLGRRVTCLIHEATFENGMLDEAAAKNHSTLTEAMQIAADMQAKTTIFTHFSQRYPKIMRARNLVGFNFSDKSIGFANDFMRVKIRDIWKLGHYLKPQIELHEKLDPLEDNDDANHVVLDE